jgi:hypothetical protein
MSGQLRDPGAARVIENVARGHTTTPVKEGDVHFRFSIRATNP